MEEGVIGAAIASARRGRKLSQERLAHLVGVSRGTIQNWERGTHTPGVDDVWRIADALDVTVDELIGRRAATGEEGGRGFLDLRVAGKPVQEVLEELLAELARERERTRGRAEGGQGA